MRTIILTTLFSLGDGQRLVDPLELYHQSRGLQTLCIILTISSKQALQHLAENRHRISNTEASSVAHNTIRTPFRNHESRLHFKLYRNPSYEVERKEMEGRVCLELNSPSSGSNINRLTSLQME